MGTETGGFWIRVRIFLASIFSCYWFSRKNVYRGAKRMSSECCSAVNESWTMIADKENEKEDTVEEVDLGKCAEKMAVYKQRSLDTAENQVRRTTSADPPIQQKHKRNKKRSKTSNYNSEPRLLTKKKKKHNKYNELEESETCSESDTSDMKEARILKNGVQIEGVRSESGYETHGISTTMNEDREEGCAAADVESVIVGKVELYHNNGKSFVMDIVNGNSKHDVHAETVQHTRVRDQRPVLPNFNVVATPSNSLKRDFMHIPLTDLTPTFGRQFESEFSQATSITSTLSSTDSLDLSHLPNISRTTTECKGDSIENNIKNNKLEELLYLQQQLDRVNSIKQQLKKDRKMKKQPEVNKKTLKTEKTRLQNDINEILTKCEKATIKAYKNEIQKRKKTVFGTIRRHVLNL